MLRGECVPNGSSCVNRELLFMPNVDVSPTMLPDLQADAAAFSIFSSNYNPKYISNSSF